MSLGVIAANISPKISGGYKSLTATTGGTATYTVPANSYFILSGYTQPNTGSIIVSMGGINYLTISSGGGASSYLGGYHLGAGTVITYTNTAISTQTAYLNGVEFINSP
jgi:hypothetical protein